MVLDVKPHSSLCKLDCGDKKKMVKAYKKNATSLLWGFIG